jgi:hypothetical protein
MSIEQRHNQRILFDTPANVHAGKGDWSGSVIDVSLQGILVRTPLGWAGKVGDHCTVSMRLEGDVVITMQASIAHIEQDYVGMHCDNIDIDSATHLRRLVELNLGDEELLNRELATLQRH